MAHKRINFSHLCGRDPHVNQRLVDSFDKAVNSEYRRQDFARCFYEYERDRSVSLEVLASEHVEKVQFARYWTMDEGGKTEFQDRAELFYRRSANMKSFSVTLLRLASCVPYNHPGQEFLLQVLKDFLEKQFSVGTRDNAHIKFQEALRGLWGFRMYTTAGLAT